MWTTYVKRGKQFYRNWAIASYDDIYQINLTPNPKQRILTIPKSTEENKCYKITPTPQNT